MIKGIYNSLAGMLPSVLRQDVIANNLANAATVGYKKDKVFLKTMLDASLVMQKDANQNPFALDAESVATDYSQGGLRSTGNPLDVAIKGQGYFVIETPNGTMYTRAGGFSLNAAGDLVDANGYPVQGEGGPITLPPGEVTISENGTVFVDGQEAARLKVVDFEEPDALEKVGQNLFKARSGCGCTTFASENDNPTASVMQGFLEDSNVDVVREMVEMIKLQNAYQTSARVLMAQDDSLNKAVNDVGVVR
jgi:flagellar basal-body rod protein FlgG